MAIDPSDLLPDAVEGLDPTVDASPVLGRAEVEQSNAERIAKLVGGGVVMNDSNPLLTAMTQNALLEEILRRIAGDAVADQVLLDTANKIADFLDVAEQQVARAKLAAPMPPGGLPSMR